MGRQDYDGGFSSDGQELLRLTATLAVAIAPALHLITAATVTGHDR